MIIKEINIKGLFGELNHRLKFEESDNINYLIGRNGSGKTTLLKSIDAIANSNWNYLKRIQFNSCELSFHDESKLIIEKIERDKYGNSKLNVKILSEVIDFDELIHVKEYSEDNIDELIKQLIDQKEIWRLDCGHWASNHESHLHKYEILEKYGSSIINLPNEISDFIKKLNVRFLGSERLLSDEAINKKHKNKRCYKVEHIAADLKNKLTEAQRIVLKNLEDVGDKLEQDLLEGGFNSFNNVSKSEFSRLYKEYQNVRNRLESASLSAESKTVEIQNKIPEDNERKLIAHIIKQRKGAYEPYSDILFNIEIFHEIVNSALTKKNVKINIKNGLGAHSEKSGKFPVNHLSSGEQQVIILAHTLLFSMEKNSIALIDEPELSMDVDWQSKLSTWLEKIGKERNLTFILATHSPLLLMGREDSIKTLNV